MKFSVTIALLGLCCLLACVGQALANPLGKVLELIDGLSQKIEADGEKEVAAYNHFQQWCDDTSANKGFTVETTTKHVAELEAKVNQEASNIEVATDKIGELAAAISKADEKLKKAEDVRTKERVDFGAAEQELMETVEALAGAVGTLEKKGAAALAQVDTTSMANLVQSLGAVLDAAAVSTSDRNRLLALVQSKASEDEDAEDDETVPVGSPQAAAYQSNSGGIVEVMEDMKDDAESQLSKLRTAETDAKSNFDMLKQAVDNQLAADKQDMGDQKAAKAKATEEKNKAVGDLDMKTKSLKASKVELKEVQASCLKQAGDHEQTVASRKEELGVLAKARAMLQENAKGVASFVQVSAQATTGLSRSRVLIAVRRLAKQHHSAALAQLSSRLTAVVQHAMTSGADPLAKIKRLISDMISKLEKQASQEARDKEFCDKEMKSNGAKEQDLSEEMSDLTAKIDKAASKDASLKAEVKDTQSDLSALAKEQASMDSIRTEERQDYEKTKADLEQGLSGVRQAMTVLHDYYSGTEAAMLQEDSDFESLLQQPAAPEHHEKASGAGASLIAILEGIEVNLAENLAKVETQESDAQSDYARITAKNKITRTSKDVDLKHDIRAIKRVNLDLSQATSDKETTSSELTAVSDYEAKLKDRCIAKPIPYEERQRRREDEINGLRQALTSLKDDAASLLQRHRNSPGLRGAAALEATDSA